MIINQLFSVLMYQNRYSFVLNLLFGVFIFFYSPCQYNTGQKSWDVVMKNPPAFDSMMQDTSLLDISTFKDDLLPLWLAAFNNMKSEGRWA